MLLIVNLYFLKLNGVKVRQRVSESKSLYVKESVRRKVYESTSLYFYVSNMIQKV